MFSIQRYRERLFYFSSDEAKQKFATNVSNYLAPGKTIEVYPHTQTQTIRNTS